jgi:glutamyl-Q tRNA(Asp) synthetase
MAPPVFRFAPSPNGRLHLGHALSALTNEAEARRLGGLLLLRLEDIDLVRCRPQFAKAIMADLDWLGIRFDGPVRQQSAHFADYAAALARLDAMGLVYPCTCSRADIKIASPAACDPDGVPLYPGTCRSRDVSARHAVRTGPAPFALRLDMGRALAQAGTGLTYRRFSSDGGEEVVVAEPERWGDVVLARKDTPTSYHLSVVVDDALQMVSHVVRGEDLEAATDLHVLLQRLLRLPTPRYQFHPLIRDAEEAKLSKSRNSRPLADLRAEGVTAAEVRQALGFGPAAGPESDIMG